jgi:hypothetical protein
MPHISNPPHSQGDLGGNKMSSVKKRGNVLPNKTCTYCDNKNNCANV